MRKIIATGNPFPDDYEQRRKELELAHKLQKEKARVERMREHQKSREEDIKRLIEIFGELLKYERGELN